MKHAVTVRADERQVLDLGLTDDAESKRHRVMTLPHLTHADAACLQTAAGVGRVWTLEVCELHVHGIGIAEPPRIGSALVNRKPIEELAKGYDMTDVQEDNTQVLDPNGDGIV